MDLALMWRSLPALLGGVPVTLQLVGSSLLLGIVLATAVALLRLSHGLVAPALAGAYVFVFRGTPLLVQIFLIYYGLGQFAIIRDSVLWPVLREPMWCAVLAFTLNTAAYTSEIIRGGILAVPHGQVEAARALGMPRRLIYRRIVAPLALRQALPAYGNEIVLMIKASSLASTVTLLEVTGIARRIIAQTYAVFEIFILAGSIYLLINFSLTWLVRILERRLSPPARRSP